MLFGFAVPVALRAKSPSHAALTLRLPRGEGNFLVVPLDQRAPCMLNPCPLFAPGPRPLFFQD